MKYLRALLYFTISFILLFSIISTFNYFGFIPNGFVRYLNLLTIAISSTVAGIYVGFKSSSKGYLEGIKIGIVLDLMLFLIGLIFFSRGIYLTKLVFYLILILASIFGSIIGINKGLREKK